MPCIHFQKLCDCQNSHAVIHGIQSTLRCAECFAFIAETAFWNAFHHSCRIQIRCLEITAAAVKYADMGILIKCILQSFSTSWTELAFTCFPCCFTAEGAALHTECKHGCFRCRILQPYYIGVIAISNKSSLEIGNRLLHLNNQLLHLPGTVQLIPEKVCHNQSICF